MRRRTLEEIKAAGERNRLIRDKWIEISLWAATLFLAMLLIGCSMPKQPPAPPPNYWYNFGKDGANYIIGPTFIFPQQSQNQVVGYVYQAPPSYNIMGKTMTLDYTVFLNGALGVADPNDIPPPSVTLFLWRQGDDLNTDKASYRFWCPARGTLDNGERVLSCVVDGNVWTNVAGLVDPNGFAQALNNLFAVGFTCGGANFYGHGCWSTGGTVTFKINSFTVQ